MKGKSHDRIQPHQNREKSDRFYLRISGLIFCGELVEAIVLWHKAAAIYNSCREPWREG
jgi:hypothetical protein